jgi:type I restriction enzyme S subunit
MRSGWENKILGDIIRLEYGKPLDPSNRNPYGRYPAYGANGAKDRTDRYYCDKPSIIVGRKGSAGEITLTEDRFWPLDVTYFVQFERERYDLQFLYYLLITLELPSLAKGVKPGLNRNEVYALSVKTPPLPEQHRIVAILDEAFAGIATAKANAEKNLQNARALFESHLQAVFSQRGERWIEKRLSEISISFGRGKSKHRPRNDPKLYGGKYPFIQTGDVRNAVHHITSYSQTYNEVGLAQSKLWPKGTLCITIAANIAETGILDFDACFPDSVIGVVVDPNMTSNKFLEYLLQSFKSQLQAKGKGSAQDNINLGTFENQLFPFPKLKEQQEIVEILDNLREGTRHLETIYQRKLAALDALKKSLLHRAFSGQL